MAEPQIVIVNREELNFLLSETSGLEYMVIFAHLFAAFSLKTEVREGLTKSSLKRSNGGSG